MGRRHGFGRTSRPSIIAIQGPKKGSDEQGSQNDSETDQLALTPHRKLSESAGDEGTTTSSPPPTGTQIWPAMDPVYGTS
jgi:hypothetical protein